MPLFYSFASTARQSARSALIELGCRMSADPAEAEGAEGSNASAASALHSRRYGACSAEAAASEAFGLSVGGCIRAWTDFGPHPVELQYDAVAKRLLTGTGDKPSRDRDWDTDREKH